MGSDTENGRTGEVKVFLVDDHEVVRRRLVDLLASDAELDVVGEAGGVGEAMARIPAVRPDVAVLDVRLPDGNGIELCRDLLSALPDLRCLMLTSYTSDEAMLDAIVAGASGYVVKDIKGMELAQAIKDVGAGKSLLDNRAAAALMAKLRDSALRNDPLSGLTDQEQTLLGLLGEGLTNRQIAARMFLAEKTVKNYVSRLLAKLGMERLCRPRCSRPNWIGLSGAQTSYVKSSAPGEFGAGSLRDALVQAMGVVSSGLELDATLRTIVHTAIGLVDARYGALGFWSRPLPRPPASRSRMRVCTSNHEPASRGSKQAETSEPRCCPGPIPQQCVG